MARWQEYLKVKKGNLTMPCLQEYRRLYRNNFKIFNINVEKAIFHEKRNVVSIVFLTIDKL